MLESANSWYNALQIRFQKRTTHHVSFEGSYTISKETDYSSAGRNNWVGAGLLAVGVQQLDNLAAEHSIGASDAPQRLAGAVVVDLPIGRNQWIGGEMNRAVDAVIGGWSVATLMTQQSGQPMAIGLNNPLLANGSQRPNTVCSQLKSGTSMHDVALNWQTNPTAINNGHSSGGDLLQCELFCRSRGQYSGQRATLFFRLAHRRHPQRGSEPLQVVRAQRRHAAGSAGGDLQLHQSPALWAAEFGCGKWGCREVRLRQIRFLGRFPATVPGKRPASSSLECGSSSDAEWCAYIALLAAVCRLGRSHCEKDPVLPALILNSSVGRELERISAMPLVISSLD